MNTMTDGLELGAHTQLLIRNGSDRRHTLLYLQVTCLAHCFGEWIVISLDAALSGLWH